jgi:carbamoyl-phosphate synthase small subunit
MKAILALEDGTVFEGKSFGSSNACQGEVVFNTSMTGYQEILTDPSYNGQIVV